MGKRRLDTSYLASTTCLFSCVSFASPLGIGGMSDAVLGYAGQSNLCRGRLHCNFSPAEDVLVSQLRSTCPYMQTLCSQTKFRETRNTCLFGTLYAVLRPDDRVQILCLMLGSACMALLVVKCGECISGWGEGCGEVGHIAGCLR
jgi:hypothetical protein